MDCGIKLTSLSSIADNNIELYATLILLLASLNVHSRLQQGLEQANKSGAYCVHGSLVVVAFLIPRSTGNKAS